jgi:bifunctional non-homologous end joining protein LigD
MGLKTYRQKRNFRATPEPPGKVAPARKDLSFVVQKHAARRLHYDFRLEIGGALASWAIPKGPSLDPKERRLAVHVEDHPVEYGKFEGTIPKGEYGAGEVEIWDRGTWVPSGDPRAGLKRGKLKFHLNGERLSGGWSLVRMGGRNQTGKDNWLLIKERDDAAAPNGRAMERSKKATTKRAGRNGRVENLRLDVTKRNHPARRRVVRAEPDLTKAEKSALPQFIRPQLATLVDSVPQGETWLHEIKFDGYRTLCRIEDGRVSFLTREGNDWTPQFAFLIDAAAALPVRQALLDGEVAALRENGVSDFQLLQNSLKGGRGAAIVYFVFDLLHLDGFNLANVPLLLRKERLAKLLANIPHDEQSPIRYSEHWIGRGNELFHEACRRSLEGVISKRIDQPYRSGRGRDWLKTKCVMSQEFVICGYTDPGGSRTGFGALLLGVYDDNGKLRYAGRVGTGFSGQTLGELKSRLSSIPHASPFSAPLTGAESKGVHWVKPELVGEVAFTGWTSDGLLRHPSFQGLREDKPAAHVTRERAMPAAKAMPGAAASVNASSDRKVHVTEIAGVKLSHPDRVLYPEQGITKLALAAYYEKIADWILPHVSGRPLTLVRCPQGHQKQCFYQRNVEDGAPLQIRSVQIRDSRTKMNCAVVESLAGLIALVQMGVLEIHTWGSRVQSLERPDQLTFDLDPDPALSWKVLRSAAEELRERLSGHGLGVFLKTTGGKGLHVVVPIAPQSGWDRAKAFAKSIAESMAQDAPELYVATMSKSRRAGKIFIDYLRNARTATAVCAYSTRARSGAPVSMPLGWDELSRDVRSDHFTIASAPGRLARLRRDPWHDYEAARRPIERASMKRRARKSGVR